MQTQLDTQGEKETGVLDDELSAQENGGRILPMLANVGYEWIDHAPFPLAVQIVAGCDA